MAEPSNPHSTPGENPEPSSPVAVAEEEGNAPGENLPVLRWIRASFDVLMRDIQIPPEYGVVYPQENDTADDAPAEHITMFADFFGVSNLRLPLTLFVVEVLEWDKLHISQLSPFGMIRVRNFEYTFRALGIERTVRDFRRFYQMTVSTGFLSFRQWDGRPKLMVPPKGLTKWKTKFFYIKAAAITARLQFRNVTDPIISENISLPRADMVDWFPTLRIIGWLSWITRSCGCCR
ncbi:hypothetical protein Hdeb2414_s0010g00332481 [Helianthus debilis subsp. tardiflorus]